MLSPLFTGGKSSLSQILTYLSLPTGSLLRQFSICEPNKTLEKENKSILSSLLCFEHIHKMKASSYSSCHMLNESSLYGLWEETVMLGLFWLEDGRKIHTDAVGMHMCNTVDGARVLVLTSPSLHLSLCWWPCCYSCIDSWLSDFHKQKSKQINFPIWSSFGKEATL